MFLRPPPSPPFPRSGVPEYNTNTRTRNMKRILAAPFNSTTRPEHESASPLSVSEVAVSSALSAAWCWGVHHQHADEKHASVANGARLRARLDRMAVYAVGGIRFVCLIRVEVFRRSGIESRELRVESGAGLCSQLTTHNPLLSNRRRPRQLWPGAPCRRPRSASPRSPRDAGSRRSSVPRTASGTTTRPGHRQPQSPAAA